MTLKASISRLRHVCSNLRFNFYPWHNDVVCWESPMTVIGASSVCEAVKLQKSVERK